MRLMPPLVGSPCALFLLEGGQDIHVCRNSCIKEFLSLQVAWQVQLQFSCSLVCMCGCAALAGLTYEQRQANWPSLPHKERARYEVSTSVGGHTARSCLLCMLDSCKTERRLRCPCQVGLSYASA